MRLNMALDLPADASMSSLCRRSVRMLLEYGDVFDADVDDLEALVDERFIAAIRNAGPASGARVCLTLTLDAGRVSVTIVDSSGGASPANPDGRAGAGTLALERTVRCAVG